MLASARSPAAPLAAALLGMSLCAASGPRRSLDTPVPSRARLRYSAALEERSGMSTHRARLLVDGDRFRLVEDLPSRPGMKPPVSVTLYDGATPPVAWSYDPVRHDAYPELGWTMRALSQAARRYGVAAVRRRYRIPAGYPLSAAREADELPHPRIGDMRFVDMRELSWRPVGPAMCEGLACRVYLTRRGSPPAPTSTVRVWVHDSTGLVLRFENTSEASRRSAAPPTRYVFTVKDLQFEARIPSESFALPRGATAHVPELFRDVRLPPGVRRVTMTGRFAATGHDFGPG